MAWLLIHSLFELWHAVTAISNYILQTLGTELFSAICGILDAIFYYQDINKIRSREKQYIREKELPIMLAIVLS